MVNSVISILSCYNTRQDSPPINKMPNNTRNATVKIKKSPRCGVSFLPRLTDKNRLLLRLVIEFFEPHFSQANTYI